MDLIAEVNGHNLHVETYGLVGGHPVFLLHHGLGSTRAWKSQIQALMDRGFHIIVYDRWGYGQSDTRNEFSMPTFEDDLLDLHVLYKEFGIERASLIGHSDGGTICLYFAARHPHLVHGLVTIAAHVFVEEKMESSIEDILEAYENNRKFQAGLYRMHGENAERVFRNWYDGWHRPAVLNWDMRPEISRINCPTFIIQGVEDEHATPGHARDIARSIPGAELWLVDDRGHMLPKEEAEEFNRRVIKFLNRVYETEQMNCRTSKTSDLERVM